MFDITPRSIIIFGLTASGLLLAGCGIFKTKPLANVATMLDISPVAEPRPMVTIWIHGTKLTPSAVMHNFFYRMLGMKKATEYQPRYHMRTICQTLHEQDSRSFNLENLYVFGWSGKLSFKERALAARNLYKEIGIICQEYQHKYGMTPYIRLITHSHGGNVALNLATVDHTEQWSINELVLLACPVQSETMHLYKSSLFEKIYSFYSLSDLIQVIDPQGLYKNKKPGTSFFSHHTFTNDPKIIQIETKSSNRGFMHAEFLLVKFIQHLPDILKTIQNPQSSFANSQKMLLQLTRVKDVCEKRSTFTVQNVPLA